MTEKESVLVTGASGFIGRNLLPALKEANYQTVALDRRVSPLTDPAKLKTAVEGKKAVIHLAGVVKSNSPDLIKANLVSTISLLEAISLSATPPLFVLASTFAVYAPQDLALTEKTPVKPRNLYGLSKKWAEETTVSYASHYGIPYFILRFANVYGPGMPAFAHSVVATFVELARKKKTITINSDGKQTRDFIYIDDVTEAIVLCLSTKERNWTINICSGQEISLNEVVKELEKLGGRKLPVEYNLRAKEDGYWIGANTFAQKVLGWHPRIPFSIGLEKTWDANRE